jgi:CysZ protein
MIGAAALALRDILSPPFRGVLLKSLALTIGLLIALWAALQWALSYWVEIPWPWLDAAFSILTGIGLVIGLGFLVAPVTALFAGLFLDDIAEVVERTHYANDPVGQPLPVGRSILTSLRFLGVVLVVNAVALPLVFLVGFGFLIFLVANAYLLGREYFELAALRHHDAATARRMRLRHASTVFAAGLAVAAVLAVPILNLLAPLFATALMVHLYKRIATADRALT